MACSNKTCVERRINSCHCILGTGFAGLLAGSFVVETIFQIPGLGRFTFKRLSTRLHNDPRDNGIFFDFDHRI